MSLYGVLFGSRKDHIMKASYRTNLLFQSVSTFNLSTMSLYRPHVIYRLLIAYMEYYDL